MTSSRLISIIIPVHNGEGYIGPLIEKILKNPYQNIEILIGDDASTDQTLNVISKYKESPKVKIIESSINIGAGAMRNKLIEAAQGFYIAIQDADDDFSENRFTTQAAFLDKHPHIDVVGSGCTLRDPNSFKDWGFLKLKKTPGKLDWYLQRSVVHASVMIKKDIIKSARYHSKIVTGEDYYFLTTLYWAGARFENLSEPLYIYHIKSNDLKTRTRRRFIDIMKSLPSLSKLFPLGTRLFFIVLNFLKVTFGIVRGIGSDQN